MTHQHDRSRHFRHAMRSAAIVTVMLASSLLLFPGCGSTMLLDKDFVKSIKAPSDAESHVIYCTDDFTSSADGKVLEKKYGIVRIGANAAAYPRVLTEDENASILRPPMSHWPNMPIGARSWTMSTAASSARLSSKRTKSETLPPGVG